MRDKNGNLILTPSDPESTLFYTLDGSEPSLKSTRYTHPVPTEGKLVVKAVAVDESSGKSSPIAEDSFDISQAAWSVVCADKNGEWAIDGNLGTNWHQRGDMPSEIVVDPGKEEALRGFRFLHDQVALFPSGIISRY